MTDPKDQSADILNISLVVEDIKVKRREFEMSFFWYYTSSVWPAHVAGHSGTGSEVQFSNRNYHPVHSSDPAQSAGHPVHPHHQSPSLSLSST